MAVDLAKLAERDRDSDKPVGIAEPPPNPFRDKLRGSWDRKSVPEGKSKPVGATREVRTYSADETAALVRALRRASDIENLGVKIEFPHDKDGEGKITYKQGTIRYAAVPRQKRARTEEQATTATPEGENGDEGEGDEGEGDEGVNGEGEQADVSEGAQAGWQ